MGGSKGFSYIFSFHMPLFFFLSGVVYRVDTIPDTRKLAKTIFNGIILPGILFNAVELVLFALRLESPFPTSLERCAWMDFYIRVVNECNIGWISAWFLTCLAGAKVTYWFLRKIHGLYLRLSILLLLFFIGNECGRLPGEVRFAFPFKFFSIPMATFYLGIGYELRNFIFNKHPQFLSNRWMLLTASILCFWIVYRCQTGETPNLAIPTCVNPGFFLITSLAGTFAVILLSRAVCIAPLRFIGQHSLCFFLLEGHVRKFILLALRWINPSLVVHPMATDLPISLIVALVILHLIVQSAITPPLEWLLATVKRKYGIVA